MRNALFRRQALYACLFLGGVTAPVWADPALPFKHYQGWRDEPVQDWRAANDRVGEVGGWRTYLREAQPAGGGGHDHGAPQPAAPGDRGHHGHHHGH
ncbi:MAG: hypothetical protein AB1720_07085 [Pseudomonadota bacterium]|jgi:hypothetical protein